MNLLWSNDKHLMAVRGKSLMNPLTIAPACHGVFTLLPKICHGGGSYGMWLNVNPLNMDDATNAHVFDNTEDGGVDDGG